MIRTLWVGINVVLATIFFGLIAIVASLLGVRGLIYSWATQQWSRGILWASGTPVQTEGLDAVDWSRPQVLVSNHLSGYDIFALASVVPIPFYFVAKKELERIPFFGHAWKAAGHISIDRSNRQNAMASLHAAGEKIRREGGTVIIFPEGTRSRTGELQPFKRGAFTLAVEAGVPLVPTIVAGSQEIVRPGHLVVRPHPIRLRFGAPVPTQGLGAERVDALSDQVRARMLEMLAGARQPAG